MNATPIDNRIREFSTVTALNSLPQDDAGNFRYLVKITWEWDSAWYLLETPLDTDDVSKLTEIVVAVYPRDEAITKLEIVTRF